MLKTAALFQPEQHCVNACVLGKVFSVQIVILNCLGARKKQINNQKENLRLYKRSTTTKSWTGNDGNR